LTAIPDCPEYLPGSTTPAQRLEQGRSIGQAGSLGLHSCAQRRLVSVLRIQQCQTIDRSEL
jgi:hypothetical protein